MPGEQHYDKDSPAQEARPFVKPRKAVLLDHIFDELRKCSYLDAENREFSLAAIRRAVDELAAAVPECGRREQEPVAWRFKPSAAAKTWAYQTEAPTGKPADGEVIEPLYGYPWDYTVSTSGALEELDRALSERANNCTSVGCSYEQHGLWKARELLAAARSARQEREMRLRWLVVSGFQGRGIPFGGGGPQAGEFVLQVEQLHPWDDPEMAKLGGGQFKWHDVPIETVA